MPTKSPELQKITPLPWKYSSTHQGALTDRWKDFPFTVQGGNGFCPCAIFGDGTNNRGVAEANAAYICLAANNHERLVSTLQDIRVWLTSPDLSKNVIEAYCHDIDLALSTLKEGK
jgi:hypothetical protein